MHGALQGPCFNVPIPANIILPYPCWYKPEKEIQSLATQTGVCLSSPWKLLTVLPPLTCNPIVFRQEAKHQSRIISGWSENICSGSPIQGGTHERQDICSGWMIQTLFRQISLAKNFDFLPFIWALSATAHKIIHCVFLFNKTSGDFLFRSPVNA